MRRLIIVTSIWLMVSCEPRERGEIQLKAAKAEIQKILENRDYSVEWTFQGCFGAGTERLEVKGSEALYTFLDFSQEDSPIEKTKTIHWSDEKLKILAEVFEAGIELDSVGLLCTTTTRYVLVGQSNYVAFEDPVCSLGEKFELLME